jgi:hypothetical protein
MLSLSNRFRFNINKNIGNASNPVQSHSFESLRDNCYSFHVFPLTINNHAQAKGRPGYVLVRPYASLVFSLCPAVYVVLLF